MIAALYVDPRGPYPSLEGVEAWDASRDARNYRGPHPVIAHPPCGPWGNMAHWCTRQDPTLAPLAVQQLLKWGGVLNIRPAPACGQSAISLTRGHGLPSSSSAWEERRISGVSSWIKCAGVIPVRSARASYSVGCPSPRWERCRPRGLTPTS